MAEAAASRGAKIDFISVSALRNPLRTARGVVLVDSIAAWCVAPWVLTPRQRARSLAAILHQPPGGVGHGIVRTAVQRKLDELLYRRCDLLIAVSKAFADDLVDTYGLSRDRICVVEPGSDLSVESVRGSALDLRLGRRIGLLCVGNWLPNKGILELLDAVAPLPADHLTLHLVGSGDADAAYTIRVRARLAAPELAGRVIIHGEVARQDIAPLYASADAFVLPSYAETYGTAFAEALTAGLATVGWRCGNLPNLIEDGKEGCLIEPGDVAGLSRTLRRLATDNEWREALSSAAQRRGQRLPTWSDAADAFFGVLSRLG